MPANIWRNHRVCENLCLIVRDGQKFDKFSSTCKTTGQTKNLLEKAAFWHEVKVVCCLHAKLITFQCTQVTDDDLADRLIGNYKTRRRNVAVPNVCLQTLTLSLESSLSSRFFHSFPKQRARSKAMPKQSIKASLGPV